MNERAKTILNFWFKQTSNKKRFSKNEAFDQKIRSYFLIKGFVFTKSFFIRGLFEPKIQNCFGPFIHFELILYSLLMTNTLLKLNHAIVKCKKCKRLVKFRNKIATEKRKQYMNEIYWGKPITGYGDPKAQLLMIGLAPAAHGGNRTGRVFTGDKSADFLFNCLHKAQLANQSNSDHRNDGLKLYNIYLTAALKCVNFQKFVHMNRQ